jgi:hypothetical protein
MELVLQQNQVVTWRFEAGKKLTTPKNIGEFIVSIPGNIESLIDALSFEVTYRASWFLRRVIFQ